MITIRGARYLGPDNKGRDQGGCPAIVEIDGVRLFTLAPKDKADEEKINKAVGSLLLNHGTR